MKYLIFFFLVFSNLIFSQSIVINKFFNSGKSNGLDDAVELLVIEKDLNLQGMILKDFSSSMNNDNGGKFLFTENPLWSKLPSGTLLIIRVNNQTVDIDTTDYVLDVGLKDTLYFKQMGSGTFDIATTELVMIKAAGNDTAGVTGSIHSFASGTAGTFFNLAPEPKIRSPRGAGSGKFAFAKNSTSSLTDFNGNDADTSSSLILGQPNNETNALFINRLRTGETKVELSPNVLKDFILFDNYPNPFNPSTTISFKLFKDLDIDLSVYNLIGNKIETIASGFYKAGYYEVAFDASKLSSGLYLYILKTRSGSVVKKMILIK